MTLKQFHRLYYGANNDSWIKAALCAVLGLSPYRVTFDALRGRRPYADLEGRVCNEWGRDININGKRPEWLDSYTGLIAWKPAGIKSDKWPWAPVSGVINWSNEGWSDIQAVRLENGSRVYEEV